MLNGRWRDEEVRAGFPPAHLDMRRRVELRAPSERTWRSRPGTRAPTDISNTMGMKPGVDDVHGGGARHDADRALLGDPGCPLAPAWPAAHHGAAHRADGSRGLAPVPDPHARGVRQRNRDAGVARGLDECRDPPPRDRRTAGHRPAARVLRRALAPGAVPGRPEAVRRVPDGGLPLAGGRARGDGRDQGRPRARCA